MAYCPLRGAEAGHDPGVSASIQWDVPLLERYSWTHIPNRGSGAESFLGLFNPGLWKLIRGGNYDAVVSYVGYVRASFWVALGETVLRAVSALRELPILGIAAGYDSPDLFHEAANSLGISDRCRFEPSREEVLDFYA